MAGGTNQCLAQRRETHAGTLGSIDRSPRRLEPAGDERHLLPIMERVLDVTNLLQKTEFCQSFLIMAEKF